MKTYLRIKMCLIVFSIALTGLAFSSEIFAQRRVYQASSGALRATTGSVETNEREIFERINQERLNKGLAELVWDANLARLARAYSEKMALENFFSHYDDEGGTVDTRAREMRIKKWSKIGENLFYSEGYGNVNNLAVEGWMKSPTHRQNILDRDYTETGIGMARSPGGRIYITQVFLRR